MRKFAPRALEVWKECIEDPDHVVPMPVRAKEAREFLGVCGYVKPQKIQSHSISTNLTLDEIEELKAKARRRAEDSGVMTSEKNLLPEETGIVLDIESLITEDKEEEDEVHLMDTVCGSSYDERVSGKCTVAE
jgi:hypothetical protein